jgi:hypothetical protein
MQKSIQERTEGSLDTSRDRKGYRHVEPRNWTNESETLPGAYLPCEGSWAEFVGDVKAFFSKIGEEIEDRFDAVRDTFRERARKRGASRAA